MLRIKGKTYHMTERVHCHKTFTRKLWRISGISLFATNVSRHQKLTLKETEDFSFRKGMESNLELIVAVSEPFEAQTVADAAPGSIEEESQGTYNNGTLSFNFEFAVALIEDNPDTVDTGSTEALNEIEGQSKFPCHSCENICKSIGGLTRYVNSKHSDSESVNIPSLTNEVLDFMGDTTKNRITQKLLKL